MHKCGSAALGVLSLGEGHRPYFQFSAVSAWTTLASRKYPAMELGSGGGLATLELYSVSVFARIYAHTRTPRTCPSWKNVVLPL